MIDRRQDPNWLASQVHVATTRLSEPADAQIAHLESLGSAAIADELALVLNDVLGAAMAIPALFTLEQRNALLAVDRQLESMSGPENDELWTERALRTSVEWTVVRERAKAAPRTLSR